MLTLNKTLHQTSHCSVLMRKAKNLGLVDVECLIHLAVMRGCSHFKDTMPSRSLRDPGESCLSDDELVILLIHGNTRYEPMAIRCAAQLLKLSRINPLHVVYLAIRERCETPLRYIASQGLKRDTAGFDHWSAILEGLGDRGVSTVTKGVLPDGSRFVMNGGINRQGWQAPYWLGPVERNE